MNDFGEILRQIRLERGMTLEEMANYLGTTKQALSRYERGERIPKITVAAKFADTLNVALETLSGFVPSDEYTEAEPPKTEEAKILSKGIDRLPKEQREQALAMFQVMFGPQYADLFTKEEEDDT